MVFAELFTLAGVAIAITIGAIVDHISQRNQRFPRFFILILCGFAVSELSNGIIFLQQFIYPLRQLEFVEFIAQFALSLVLFKEGLEIDLSILKKNIKTVSILATIGILITAVIFAIFASILTSIGFLLALLIAGILIPTDPAATLGLFSGEIQIKAHEKNIIVGESALNDAVAIVLVTTILTVSVSRGALTLTFSVILDFISSFIGGILIGYALAMIFLFINSKLNHSQQQKFISFGLVTLSFAIAVTLTISGIIISSAIASLSAGIVFSNPESFNFQNFQQHHINEFNENISEFGEIVAFVTLGTLMSFNKFWLSIALGLGFTVFILISRIITTIMLRRYTKLSIDESIFVSWAGMRGLATGVLASVALLQLSDFFSSTSGITSSLFINSILMTLIFTAVIQSLSIKKVGQRTNSISEKDRVAELRLERRILVSKLRYYRDLLDSHDISQDTFTMQTISIRDRLDEVNKELTFEQQSRVNRVEELFGKLKMSISVIEYIHTYVDDTYDDTNIENIPGYPKFKELTEERDSAKDRLEDELKQMLHNIEETRYSPSILHDIINLTQDLLAELDKLEKIDNTDNLENIQDLLTKINDQQDHLQELSKIEAN